MTDEDKKIQEFNRRVDELQRALKESQDSNWNLASMYLEVKKRNEDLNAMIVEADLRLENIQNFLKEKANQ